MYCSTHLTSSDLTDSTAACSVGGTDASHALAREFERIRISDRRVTVYGSSVRVTVGCAAPHNRKSSSSPVLKLVRCTCMFLQVKRMLLFLSLRGRLSFTVEKFGFVLLRSFLRLCCPPFPLLREHRHAYGSKMTVCIRFGLKIH